MAHTATNTYTRPAFPLLQRPFQGHAAKVHRQKATLNNLVSWVAHLDQDMALHCPILPGPHWGLYQLPASRLGPKSHAKMGRLQWEHGACHLYHLLSPGKKAATTRHPKQHGPTTVSLETLVTPIPNQRQSGSSFTAMHLTSAATCGNQPPTS